KIENSRDVGVPQLLSRRYMFFKCLALARIHTLRRDQRHSHRLSDPLIDGFVARCRTSAGGFVRSTVILKTDTVVLEECRALHNRPRSPRHNYDLAAPPLIQP